MWEKTGYIHPLPPNFGHSKKRGRPSKARRRGKDEEPAGGAKKRRVQSLPKLKYAVTCSWCNRKGHSERTCIWKKFAESFPMDNPFEEYGQGSQATDAINEEEPLNNEQEQPIHEQEPTINDQAPTEINQDANEIPPLSQTQPSQVGGTSAQVIVNDSSVEARNVIEDIVDEFMTSLFIDANPPPQITKPKKGVNFRMPPPMTFHPNEAVTNQRQEGGELTNTGVPTMMIGGKKYVTMGNLQAAMMGKAIKKKKGPKNGK